MKRSADNSAGPAHNADTRLRKLKTDNSGRPILPVDKKKEKAEDKAKDAVTEILEGLAVTLENDPNGQGRELWNNPGVGQVYRHKRLQQMMGDALFITSSGRSLKPVSGATWETSRTQPYQAITISQYLEASFDDDENIDWQSAHGHLPETTAAIPEVL